MNPPDDYKHLLVTSNRSQILLKSSGNAHTVVLVVVKSIGVFRAMSVTRTNQHFNFPMPQVYNDKTNQYPSDMGSELFNTRSRVLRVSLVCAKREQLRQLHRPLKQTDLR